ncbi:GIY-YIG nuclease family protein [Patescibacteria group bacterium]|nr:GIY-YIG nuclease family protein [Patescibacteria group bacterium]
MNYVYILKSCKDNCLYVGQTYNLQKRLNRHNNGHVKSTRQRRPFEIIYSEKFESRGEAIKREKYLKKLKGGNELKRILESKSKQS